MSEGVSIRITTDFCLTISYVVHSNTPFHAVENSFFLEFIATLHPSYSVLSHYVLTHSIMEGKAAQIQMEEIGWLKS